MIYPSYGVRLNTVEEALRVRSVLQVLHINNLPQVLHINNLPQRVPMTCYVDGEWQRVREDSEKPIPIVSTDEFCKIYTDFYNQLYNFIENLKVGDKVIIEQRRGSYINYPYSFTDEMIRYSGKEMTITGVGQYSYSGNLFSNYSDKCFYLEEDGNAFTWHSSMFEMGDITPIKRINLSDIPINLSILE